MHREESLWLLSTLPELYSNGRLSGKESFWIEICLAILLNDAPNWNDADPPDIVLLDAVVTLAAMSCSPDRTNRLGIFTSSREHPWLLLNVRNPNLISGWFEDTPSYYHKQLISLLFLVIHALRYRRSYPLAIQYFNIITAKGDLHLYSSALTAIAPSMRHDGPSTIALMLVAPQAQDLASTIYNSWNHGDTVQEELLKNYDDRLGDSENPDPNVLAIVLMLSKYLSPVEIFSVFGTISCNPLTASYSQSGLRLNTNGNGYERPWQSSTLVMKQSNECTGGCATPPPTIGLSNRARAPMIPASYNRS